MLLDYVQPAQKECDILIHRDSESLHSEVKMDGLVIIVLFVNILIILYATNELIRKRGSTFGCIGLLVPVATFLWGWRYMNRDFMLVWSLVLVISFFLLTFV